MNLSKDLAAAVDQWGSAFQWAKWGTPLRIDRGIPRAKFLDSEGFASFGRTLLDQRQDHLLDGVVKLHALGGTVIEALQLAKAQGPVVVEPGVECHLMT